MRVNYILRLVTVQTGRARLQNNIELHKPLLSL